MTEPGYSKWRQTCSYRQTGVVLMTSAKHSVTQMEGIQFLNFTELQKKMVKISRKDPAHMWGNCELAEKCIMAEMDCITFFKVFI
jgi:hypothetical protein